MKDELKQLRSDLEREQTVRKESCSLASSKFSRSLSGMMVFRISFSCNVV